MKTEFCSFRPDLQFDPTAPLLDPLLRDKKLRLGTKKYPGMKHEAISK